MKNWRVGIIFLIVAIVAILCMLLALSGCGDSSAGDESAKVKQLQSTIAEQANEIQRLEQSVQQKENTIAALQEQSQDPIEQAKECTYPHLPEGFTGEAFREDLRKHTELIPFEAVSGATNGFEIIHILSDQHVYTTAGDDHNYANMLLQYRIHQNKDIAWTVLAYQYWGTDEMIWVEQSKKQ